MGLLDRFRRYFQPAKPKPQTLTVRALPGGRASLDSVDMLPSNSWLIVPPANYETNWQLLNLSSKDFDQITPARLLEVLADLSPEVSRAQWDFLRMANPGWEIEALKPGTDTQDKRATAMLTEFIDRMSDFHGSFDIVLGRMFLSAFLRGAFCSELVLNRRGRIPLDIATPDPQSIRFRQRSDPERGQVWQPGQWQAYNFVPLDMPTFRYMPIDPMPGSPYGRPIAAPALFVSLFLLGLLHDLRRVIQQQGYPRLDISIDLQQLIEAAPQLAVDTTTFNEFVANLVDEVETVYSSLQPDDAYIHTSNVTVNRPIGAADSTSLGGIDAVITALERMCVRALKTMPLMMGITDSVGDVQSNRQFEVFAAGIKSIQHYCETMLERLFVLSLQAQGVQADVRFRFAELRAAEELRDSQTEAMRIANAKAKYEQGWITHDQASEEITGKPAAESEPLAGVGNTPSSIVQGDNDGQELVRTIPEGWFNEVREARSDVKDALRLISQNGFSKHHDE